MIKLIIIAVLTLSGTLLTETARPRPVEAQPSAVVQEIQVKQLNKVTDIKISDIASSGKIKPEPPQNNEDVVWNFLIAQGFTKVQTAGIMGNLKQEHQFRTDGDGLAQWTDNRKANMLARPNPYSIESQLQYLMIELNGGYAHANSLIRASSTVEDAVRAFQNKFEVCGDCRENQRINYAYEILARH